MATRTRPLRRRNPATPNGSGGSPAPGASSSGVGSDEALWVALGLVGVVTAWFLYDAATATREVAHGEDPNLDWYALPSGKVLQLEAEAAAELGAEFLPFGI